MAERPTIQTARLVLRPFGTGDAEAIARICGDREIAANTLTIPHPYTLEDAKGWLAMHAGEFDAGKSVVCAVTLKETGEVVGCVGLVINRPHDRAEMGYWTAREHRGRGYAPEAAAGLIRYGFEGLGLNRIDAHHFSTNPGSGRVMEKAGMVREGVVRQHIKKWGEYKDCVIYSILRGEIDRLAAAERERT